MAKETGITKILVFSKEIVGRMEDLMRIIGADELIEVIRRALAVYDCLWERKNSGCEIIIRDQEGNEQTLELR